MTNKAYPLGIDVGGSGIKGAPVDLDTGEFAAERLRLDTPQGATPGAVADVIASIVEHFADQIGAGRVVRMLLGLTREHIAHDQAAGIASAQAIR